MNYRKLNENHTDEIIVWTEFPKDDFLNTNITLQIKHTEKPSHLGRLLIFSVAGIYFFTIGNTDVLASSLDVKAEELYYGKFLSIAKWLIIGKCGWDTVSKTLKEDFQGAKKSVIAAAIMFGVLTGLPWAFNELDLIFRG